MLPTMEAYTNMGAATTRLMLPENAIAFKKHQQADSCVVAEPCLLLVEAYVLEIVSFSLQPSAGGGGEDARGRRDKVASQQRQQLATVQRGSIQLRMTMGQTNSIVFGLLFAQLSGKGTLVV